VEAIFRKWGLESAALGRVTDTGRLRIAEDGRPLADIPARLLSHDAPTYDRPSQPPADLAERRGLDEAGLSVPSDLGEILLQLLGSPNLASRQWVYRQYDHMLGSPNLASRQWVYRQYDHMVQTNTVVAPGADAAVLRVKGTEKGLALCTEGNGRYCYLDPRGGTELAAAEAARGISCVGALPLAVTNCLNFGNPERPEVMWEFVEAVEGLAEACRQLDTPVTGGNVSFYNETMGRSIYPTPVVGMVGLLQNVSSHCTPGFKKAGHIVALLGGPGRGHLGGTEYLRTVHGVVAGSPPEVDWDRERAVNATCRAAIERGLLSSAHDLSDGGLAVALAECCFMAEAADIGVEAVVPWNGRPDAVLFGEDSARILVSLDEDRWPDLEQLAEEKGAPLLRLGRVTAARRLFLQLERRRGPGGDRQDSHLSLVRREKVLDEEIGRLRHRWEGALPWLLS